jgi:glycosyltransferase involved in cell wall biosynthesis
MIVRDEAFFLARCLDAVVDYVDEIIIVDTGSVDETPNIAARYTDKIFHFDWVDDFAAARNFSLDKASGDWILVLDADELVSPEGMETIRSTLRDAAEDAFFLVQFNYNNDPLTRDWQPVAENTAYSGGYAGYRRNPIGRLFRNGKNIHFQGAVHEVIDRSLEGLNYSELEVVLHHHMDDNPDKPRKDRQLNYLRMIEKALAKGANGRLAESAGAVHMYYTGDFPAAIRYFRQAVENGYHAERNTENLAEAHYRMGDFDQARTVYSQLYRGGYRSFALLTNLANLLVKAGDYRGALNLLEQALASPGIAEEAEARLRHNIAYLESKQNGD